MSVTKFANAVTKLASPLSTAVIYPFLDSVRSIRKTVEQRQPDANEITAANGRVNETDDSECQLKAVVCPIDCNE